MSATRDGIHHQGEQTLNKPAADAECLRLGKRRILLGLGNLSLSLATDIRCWSTHYSMVSATPSHNGF